MTDNTLNEKDKERSCSNCKWEYREQDIDSPCFKCACFNLDNYWQESELSKCKRKLKEVTLLLESIANQSTDMIARINCCNLLDKWRGKND